MKHIMPLLGIFLLATMSNSCTPEEQESPSRLKSRSSTPVEYRLIGGEGFLALFKQNGNHSDDIFILRNSSRLNIDQSLSVQRINQEAERLEVSLSNGSKMFWSVNAQLQADYYGFSLAVVSGPSNYDLFYKNGLPRSNPDVQNVRCVCKSNWEVAKCDAGGAGSTDCAIESGGTLAGLGLNDKCSVKCGTGHYACCSK